MTVNASFENVPHDGGNVVLQFRLTPTPDMPIVPN
jgi:hypothetical protein